MAPPDIPTRYRLSLHRVEGGYVARMPDLPGCFARGRSEVEAVENARAALRAWLGVSRCVADAPALVELHVAP
ncbi:MAG TPA: type II toxin-antitoxin system HicB family antitoxin [Usitatibacter sp.]|jgi:predicted RNase H-like HicB family nuclease|nr:type II toxin-antitoxin system HicB family antitoxin [Usitatibacter sp.]